MKDRLIYFLLTAVFFLPFLSYPPAIYAQGKHLSKEGLLPAMKNKMQVLHKEKNGGVANKKTAAKLIDTTVSAKNGLSLTVAKDGKSYAVNTSSETKMQRHFWGQGNLDEIQVGHHLNIWGSWANDAKTTINARLIRNLSVTKRSGVFMGQVIAKVNNSFTLRTLNHGELAVYFTNKTKFVKRNNVSVTYTTLQINDRVRVRGLWDNGLKQITEVTEIRDYTLPL